MVKLTRSEIEEHIALEGQDFIDGTKIPENAHSKFRFDIKEDVADLVRQMKKVRYSKEVRHIDMETGDVYFSGGRGHSGKQHNGEWHKAKETVYKKDLETGEEFTSGGKFEPKTPWLFKEATGVDKRFIDYELVDPYFHCSATVKDNGDHLSIVTAWSGFVYDIYQKEDGGCTVEFSGPLNGLLQQNLLPSMTYVPGTLEGKFLSNDDKEELTPYLDIDTYCMLRAQKNHESANAQDGYGAQMNAQFNNEIPVFGKWVDKQTWKQKRAQEKFGEKIPDYKREMYKKIAKKRQEYRDASMVQKRAMDGRNGR